MISAFSQSTPLWHSMVCRARPPSSFPTHFSADRVFPLRRSSFVGLTLSMCSFFLVWKRRHVSPKYTVSWQEQGILYTTHFCLSPSGSWHVRLISFIFLPGLKARFVRTVQENCQPALFSSCFQTWKRSSTILTTLIHGDQC